MDLKLHKSNVASASFIKVSGSKSETNRLLLLQALYPSLVLSNQSNSDDSDVMQKALNGLSEKVSTIDVHHAGTAMRFLTAFFSIQDGKETVLTGSNRMLERPISVLVDALRQLGVQISYLEQDGFPPIKITGKKIDLSHVTLKADVSSQYISAILLIAPKLDNGLEMHLEGEITSLPYINMTLSLLNQLGVSTSFESNVIKVQPLNIITTTNVTVESDWSSASYWYSIVALSAIGTSITLSSYKKNSLQGDAFLAEIYKDFGVETFFNNDNSITIVKEAKAKVRNLNRNLNNCPDIAQTIAVTCFGLGIGCDLDGLHTLKIKETDRLVALKEELIKLGATISVTDESLLLKPSKKIIENIVIKTYQDHRMAMAFAPLALRVPIQIEEAEVVSKSYPDYWDDLKKVGFRIQ
ncbi:3-phosphoshikimate 1-carboxyvinyltransferase [Flavobacterium chuncheonense]|uniref:3-phosphoshikimate 1-carboxyvinyltransferase n=1 Tax=Flavobacterium chuncheonense TaxID=2026653 RepID=A0ABW5YLD1_9FLAO